MSSESVQILVRRDTRAHYVQVCGEIDVFGAGMLHAVLATVAADQPHRVAVDLSGATFFGCAGVSALIAARRILDGRLAVVSAAASVRRVLNLLHLASMLEAAAEG